MAVVAFGETTDRRRRSNVFDIYYCEDQRSCQDHEALSPWSRRVGCVQEHGARVGHGSGGARWGGGDLRTAGRRVPSAVFYGQKCDRQIITSIIIHCFFKNKLFTTIMRLIPIIIIIPKVIMRVSVSGVREVL